MFSNIIIEDIKEFTKSINEKLGKGKILINNPFKKNKMIYYLPKEILSDIPMPENMYEIDNSINANFEFRNYVNKYIGKTWKNFDSELKKEAYFKAIKENKKIIYDSINQYKNCTVDQYDFEKDAVGDASIPVLMDKYFYDRFITNYDSKSDFFIKILQNFKSVVEDNNGLCLLKNDDGTPKKEKACQKLLYVYLCYMAKANNIELSPETNSGRGPVDYKISCDDFRMLIEIKRLSSTHYLSGIKTQLPIYGEQERIDNWVYMVINDIENPEIADKKLRDIYDVNNDAVIKSRIIVLDISKKISASK